MRVGISTVLELLLFRFCGASLSSLVPLRFWASVLGVGRLAVNEVCQGVGLLVICYIYIYIYTHTYIHTYIHTYVHIHLHQYLSRSSGEPGSGGKPLHQVVARAGTEAQNSPKPSNP